MVSQVSCNLAEHEVCASLAEHEVCASLAEHEVCASQKGHVRHLPTCGKADDFAYITLHPLQQSLPHIVLSSMIGTRSTIAARYSDEFSFALLLQECPCAERLYISIHSRCSSDS